MAARRNKNQARRTGGGGNGTPGWVWLVVGVVLGAALLFTVPGMLKKDGDGFFRPKPNPDAQPAPVAEADTGEAVEDVPARPKAKADDATAKETDYQFYDLLPGKEVRMSDAELAASARAEQERAEQERQRALQAAQQARDAQAQDTTATPVPVAATSAPVSAPRPIDESATTPAPASTTRPAEPRTVASAPPKTDTRASIPAPAAPAAAADPRYILQAGAFGASGDAEATKARIALLGLSARVESAQINGKTVYRVRMGPYGTASELAEAKQKLSGSGLSAMAIRAQ